MTLVELLIVVAIALVLVAASVPMMKPALDEGRIREASRQLSAFLATAKARATQIGRPAGIWIERSEPGSNAGFDVFMAEMPPPYSGDVMGATVNVVPVPPLPARFYDIRFGLPGTPGPENSESLLGLFEVGDRFIIQFNYMRNRFQATVTAANRATPEFTARIDSDFDGFPPTGTGFTFQIYRNPERSLSRSLQLTGGTIVDLEFSGTGLDFDANYPSTGNTETPHAYPARFSRAPGLEFAALNTIVSGNVVPDDQPVVIMFNPGGSVERVMAGGVSAIPTGTIHLLLGKFAGQTERAITASLPWSVADPLPVEPNQNLVDSSHIWVSVGHRTGLVTTAPNGWLIDTTLRGSLRAAREFSQRDHSSGGQ